MNKKILISFIIIFQLLLVKPIMDIQYSQDIYRLSATSVPLPFHRYNISTVGELPNFDHIIQMITIADKTEVNLFYLNSFKGGNIEDHTFKNFIYLTDKKYLDRLPIRGLLSIEELNNSDKVYSTEDKSVRFIMDNELTYTLTSLKNLDEPFMGYLDVSAKSEEAIEKFIQLTATSLDGVQLARDKSAEDALAQLPPILEFFKQLGSFFSLVGLSFYGVLCSIFLYILMAITRDSRKITIKKAQGYSNSGIILEFMRQYIPPFILLGPISFICGYILYGGNFVTQFFATFIKYESVLFGFAGVITLLCLLTLFYITSIIPAELVKRRESQKSLVTYAIVIKILIIFLLIPGLVTHMIETETIWSRAKYKIEEQRLYADAYKIEISYLPLVEDLDCIEFYNKIKDTGILFSKVRMDLGEFIDGQLLVIVTNSKMINNSKLTVNGKILELPEDKQFVILSGDVDAEAVKKYLVLLAEGNYQQSTPSEIEVIQLDPSQKILAQYNGLNSPELDHFVLTVNTFVPTFLGDYFYMDLDSAQKTIIEGLLNEGFETETFSLKPYVEESDRTFQWQVKVLIMKTISAVILLIASILATNLFYNSTIDIIKKKLTILYMHGTSIYLASIKPLIVVLAGNIVLALLCWLIAVKSMDTFYVVQFSFWQFLVAVAILSLIEVLIWINSVNILTRKKKQILHGE